MFFSEGLTFLNFRKKVDLNNLGPLKFQAFKLCQGRLGPQTKTYFTPLNLPDLPFHNSRVLFLVLYLYPLGPLEFS